MPYRRRRMFAQICMRRVEEENKRMAEIDAKNKTQQQSGTQNKVSIEKLFPGGSPQ